MSNVILVGAFGQGNPGDEALCAAFCGALVDHHVTVISADPATTSRDHGRESILATSRNVAVAARRADAVVVGGGTVFKQLASTAGRAANGLLANVAALVAGAHASGTSVAMIGVGAGRLRGGAARSLCRWIVPHSDLIVLRDEESAAVLADTGTRPPFWIGADPAWRLFDVPHDADRNLDSRRTITIALSHHAVERADIGVLITALRPLVDEWHIRLQPWQTGNNTLDDQLALIIQQRLGRAEIIPAPKDIHDAARTFANDALVIAMRFHALVAAAAGGARFVAISHEPKLAGLARRLDQASVPGHATPEVLRATIAWALVNEPAAPEALRRERAGADLEFEMLELLLSGGAVAEPNRVPAMALSSGKGKW
jgi:polysaccharide pyruvyl transferase WcaK-like protein